WSRDSQDPSPVVLDAVATAVGKGHGCPLNLLDSPRLLWHTRHRHEAVYAKAQAAGRSAAGAGPDAGPDRRPPGRDGPGRAEVAPRATRLPRALPPLCRAPASGRSARRRPQRALSGLPGREAGHALWAAAALPPRGRGAEPRKARRRVGPEARY